MAMGSGAVTPLTSIVFGEFRSPKAQVIYSPSLLGRLVTAITSFYSSDMSTEDITDQFTLEIRECV